MLTQVLQLLVMHGVQHLNLALILSFKLLCALPMQLHLMLNLVATALLHQCLLVERMLFQRQCLFTMSLFHAQQVSLMFVDEFQVQCAQLLVVGVQLCHLQFVCRGQAHALLVEHEFRALFGRLHLLQETRLVLHQTLQRLSCFSQLHVESMRHQCAVIHGVHGVHGVHGGGGVCQCNSMLLAALLSIHGIGILIVIVIGVTTLYLDDRRQFRFCMQNIAVNLSWRNTLILILILTFFSFLFFVCFCFCFRLLLLLLLLLLLFAKVL
mmetsp:Transcript_40637/g.66788  ORF Transcript_40637/g.66788 Transcript_40637/m.66788 type:complete len:267 (-) Transcript_40637:978-1778(-)